MHVLCMAFMDQVAGAQRLTQRPNLVAHKQLTRRKGAAKVPTGYQLVCSRCSDKAMCMCTSTCMHSDVKIVVITHE